MTKPMPSPKQVHYTRVLDISSTPTQPSVAAITRRQHATGIQTPASSHIATFHLSSLLTISSTLQTADPNTANYGSSHFRPLNSSCFHLRPNLLLRAPHAPLNQAHVHLTETNLLMNHYSQDLDALKGPTLTAEPTSPPISCRKCGGLLGIQAKLHISHHPISSGQVERAQ